MNANNKVPQTWTEFIAWAKEPNHGGPLCDCGKVNCMTTFSPQCPYCGWLLTMGVHVNSPTIIVGCEQCNRSVAYLKLERS